MRALWTRHPILRGVIHRCGCAFCIITRVNGQRSAVEREVCWRADECAKVRVGTDDIAIYAVGQIAGIAASGFDQVVVASDNTGIITAISATDTVGNDCVV